MDGADNLSLLNPVNKSIADNENREENKQIDWPKNVELYQTIEETQMLFSDAPNCLYIQAVLRMCGLSYRLVEKHNAEDLALFRELPVLKCNKLIVSGICKIAQFIETKGVSLTRHLDDSENCELSSYISLVNITLSSAANFLTWIDKETFENVTSKRFSSVCSWPLSKILLRRKRKEIENRLRALGWVEKTFAEVCGEVECCLSALSGKLGDSKYFFGDQPTLLDALVFAHVYTILNVPMPKTQFAEAMLKHRNIIQHCTRILDKYFGEFNTSDKFTDLLKNI